MKSILLFAPAEHHKTVNHGPVAYAIALARTHGAALTIFTVALDVTTPGRAIDAAAVGQSIADAASAEGIASTLVTEHSHAVGIHEVVAAYARLHDLTVAGCSDDGMLSERAITEHLLFNSGRPLIVVPADHSAPPAHGHVAVAWDDTPSAARTLADTQLLLQPASVTLLSIDGEKALLPVIDTASTLAMLTRRGLIATSQMRPSGDRSVAEALQAEAAAIGAGMLVMGAFGHSRMRRYMLGSATGGLLSEPRMPTLLSH